MRRVPSHIDAMHLEYLRMVAGWRSGHGTSDLSVERCREGALQLFSLLDDENWIPLADDSLYDAQPDICSQ